MEPRVSLITLGVTSVPLSRAFYERLGWTASKSSGEKVAFFQLGGLALALYGIDDLTWDTWADYKGKPGAVTLAYNVRTEPEVQEILEHARTAGATVLRPASKMDWGGTVGYFADPDGHIWEVAWNPDFDLDDAGNLLLPV